MEEFAKIKDEVPSAIMDAHMKNVKEAVRQHALIFQIRKVLTFYRILTSCILKGGEWR